MEQVNALEAREMRLLKESFSRLIGWERAKKREQLLLSALFYSLALSLLFLPFSRALPIWLSPTSLPAICFVILAPTFLFAGRWRRNESLQRVYAIDKSLGLQERALTGWEIVTGGKVGAAEQLVLKEAAERLKNINPKSLLRRRLGWQYFFTPLIFALWLLFFWLDPGAHLDKSVKASQPDPAAKKLKEFSISLKEKAESQGLTESGKIAAALKELAEKKLAGLMTEANVKENLARLIEKIDSIERKLRKSSAPFFLGASQESLADLKAELKTLRPAFGPNFSERETKLPPDLLGKISNLPRLRNELQRERLSAEEMRRNDLKSFLDKLDSEVSNELELRALSKARSFIQDSLTEPREELAPAEAEVAGEAKQPRVPEGEKALAKGEAPGHTPGTKRDAQGLPLFKGTALTHLKGLLGKGESSSLTVRGEPAAGGSHVAKEEVVTSYRRHAEEELSSEEIPEGIKEAVKRYFLLLGTNGEGGEQNSN